jgi:TPR repeat protein
MEIPRAVFAGLSRRPVVLWLVMCGFAALAQVPGKDDVAARAQRGDAEAQYHLAVRHQTGRGAEQNNSEAFKWFRKAAEQGHAKAQSEVGYFHERGLGTPVDYAEAIKWYRKSAEQGLPTGMNNLGAMYCEGKGVPQDAREAAKWFRRAAEQGLPVAQRNLARLHTDGRGVPQDYVEAYKWFQLAALQGDADARKGVESVSLRMTADEIAEARRRAEAFNKGRGGRPHRTGSGFFVTEDGYFLTNFHVVGDAARLVIKTGAGNLPARLVRADRANDVALLKVEGEFKSLPLAASRTAKLGDAVFTIGFPNIHLQGVEPKLTDGKISSLAGANDDPRFFQISVATQPGNSGGALVNSSGHVIGLVTARMSETTAFEKTGALPQNVNFALKSAYALALLESLPEVAAGLKTPRTATKRRFEDVVKEAQQAAALVFAD